MIDIEPEQVIARIARVLPIMRARLEHLMSGPDAAVAAATTTRVVISQYVVRSDDADQFLAQVRHAAGIKTRPSSTSVRPTVPVRASSSS